MSSHTGSIPIVIRPNFCSAQIYNQIGPHKTFGALTLFGQKMRIIFIEIFPLCLPPCIYALFPTSMKEQPPFLTKLFNITHSMLHSWFQTIHLCYKKFCSQSDNKNKLIESLFTKIFLEIHEIWTESQTPRHMWPIIKNMSSRSIKNLFLWTKSHSICSQYFRSRKSSKK